MEVGRTASAHHWFEWRKKTDFVGRAGRFQQKQMENVLRRYVKEYVTCHTCRSPDTILQKETRLFFLQCETCGSRCSVASIKSGFQVRHSLHLDFVDRLTSWSFIFALLFFVMLRFIRFFQCELDFVANVGLVLFYSETNCFFLFFYARLSPANVLPYARKRRRNIGAVPPIFICFFFVWGLGIQELYDSPRFVASLKCDTN